MKRLPSILRNLRRSFVAQASYFGSAPVTKLEEADFRVLAEASSDVIVRMGRDRLANYVSPSSLRVLGWAPEELIGRSPTVLVLEEDLPIVMAAVVQAFSSEENSGRLEFRARKKDGSILWVEGNGGIVRDPATDQANEIVITMRDVTERKLLEKKLSAMALTDGLTGLANRRAFDEALDREWHHTLRNGIEMSLVMLDLDHFKQYNDCYGHQAGDGCLCAVAEVLIKTARRPAIWQLDTAAKSSP